MSESELRRRIETAILGRDAIVAAQAVIDEFGLTVETRIGRLAGPAFDQSRVVGRWESKP